MAASVPTPNTDERDLEFLLEVSRRLVDDLRATAESSGARKSPRGSQLLKLVDYALTAFNDDLDRQADEFKQAGDDDDRRAVLERVRTLGFELRSLHVTLPWLEGLERRESGVGFAYLLDEMARAMLGKPADVIPTPNPQYMYAVYHRPFRNTLAVLQQPYPVGPAPIVVYYPAQEPDTLLLHLICGHELGHSAIYDRLLLQQISVQHPDMPSVMAKVAESGVARAKTFGLDPTMAEAAARVSFGKWVGEILCDVLATSYLGPSFALTFATFSYPFSGNIPSETHPATSLRMSFVLERLEALGWSPLLSARVPNIEAWVNMISAQPLVAGAQNEHYRLLHEAVELLRPTILSVGSLGGSDYLPAQFASGGELEERIHHDVLPAQLLNGDPADRRSILLAGWLAAIDRDGDAPATLPAVARRREYQAFLTKALEMSFVLENWKTL